MVERGWCSVRGKRWDRRSSSTTTLFFVRYTLGPKKQLSIFRTIQHNRITWQHFDEMNTWFYLKIKEGQVKEAVEKRVNIILVHRGRGRWPARSI